MPNNSTDEKLNVSPQNLIDDPGERLAVKAKKADWAIVRRVRVIPARLQNLNHSDVSALFWKIA
jgi:hypothetical protein